MGLSSFNRMRERLALLEAARMAQESQNSANPEEITMEHQNGQEQADKKQEQASEKPGAPVKLKPEGNTGNKAKGSNKKKPGTAKQ
jgi:hypothetical protein